MWEWNRISADIGGMEAKLDGMGSSVIFVNENENGEKRENNEFVYEN